MDDGPVTPDVIRWAANRIIDQHEPPRRPNAGRPGRCAHCPPEESGKTCALLTEARMTLLADRLPHPLT